MVVVVDDDLSMRKALQRLLRTAGWGVRTFASAGEFMAAEPIAPACIVLDVCLAGLSGLDLQQQLAALHPTVSVVMISGQADADLRERALHAGAVAFLDKPFDDQVLLAAVAKVVAAAHRS